MLRQFLSYYKPYKKLFTLDFSCAVTSGLLELSFPLVVNIFIDRLLPGQNWTYIMAASIGLLLIYLLNTGLQFIVHYWGHMLGINIETDMRQQLFNHVQKLSFRFFDQTKTGHLVSRLTNDLFEIGEMAHHGPEDLFIAIMTLMGAFSVMFYINWQLALLIFIVIPLLLWFAVYFNRKMIATVRRMYGDIADFNARIENNVSGIRVVQAFANETFEQKQFSQNNARFRISKLLGYKIISFNLSISYLLMRLITLTVLLFGTWFVIQGNLTSGGFVAFVLLTNVLFRPIEKINAIIESYPKGIAGFQRFMELMNTEPDVTDAPDAIEVKQLRGEIHYNQVSFGYEADEPILQNIQLQIRVGETIAFVGPSGAGKTTLCSLLPRFYDVNDGHITIDQINIKQMKLASLRQQIGIVQQDVFLFSGTIRENIAYGQLQADESEIWKAAERAQLKDFIQSQADGLDTVIGERGVMLSGGQKQRIAIARMFLKNPPILILDEATSALDTETESAIQKALAELSQGRTTLVIAHRLATIKNADRIVVVNEEGISEQGSHEVLMRNKGHYYNLYQAQFVGQQHLVQ